MGMGSKNLATAIEILRCTKGGSAGLLRGSVGESLNHSIRLLALVVAVTVSAAVPAFAQVPVSPTNLKVVGDGAVPQVLLTWTDKSNNEDGFKVERKVGASGSWGLYSTVGSNTTNMADTGVIAGITYSYRVFAFNYAGASPRYSNEACGTPLAMVSLSAPQNDAAIPGGPVTLSWEAVAGADSYSVQVGSSCGTSNIYKSATTDLSVMVTSLSMGTYYWRVQAAQTSSCGGVSAWSGCRVFSVTTNVPAIRIEPLTLSYGGNAPSSAASQLPQTVEELTPSTGTGEPPVGLISEDTIIVRFKTPEAARLHSLHLSSPKTRLSRFVPEIASAGLSSLPPGIKNLSPYISGKAKAMRSVNESPKLRSTLSAQGEFTASDVTAAASQITKANEPFDPMGMFYAHLEDSVSPQDAIAEMEKRDDVVYACPSPIYKPTAAPNDPLYSRMWNLSRLNMSAAWDISGNNVGSVKVCVIDTGVRISHNELEGRTADPKDVYLSNGDAYGNSDLDDDDPDGHGTACAGIIASIRDNNALVAGIAPVTIIPVNCSVWYEDYEAYLIANYTDGVLWGVDHGADVISMSFGGSGAPYQAEIDAANYAANHGVLGVVAAGNDGSDTAGYFPASIPSYMCVAAVDDANLRVSKPKWWWGSNYGNAISVCAPGQGEVGTNSDSILTLGRTSDNATKNSFNGTSAATPHVAGVAALLRHVNPALSAVDIRRILETTARDRVGSAAEDTVGWDRYYGHGLINAAAAVNVAKYGEPKTVTIYNDGAATLNVTSIQLDSPASWITFNPQAPLTINPGKSQPVAVTVNVPTAPPGQSTRRLVVQSNDSTKSPYPNGVNVVVNNGATEYMLSLEKNGGGRMWVNGTIRTLPWSAAFSAGSIVSLTAVPYNGWSFSNWSGDLTGSANPMQITMNGDKSVTANFGSSENDLHLISADFSPASPVAVQPGSALGTGWRVEGPASQFWCEFMLSKTGGFDLWRGGATLTGSSQWNFTGGDETHSPTDQMVNWIPDGIYTAVAMVNRPGTGSFIEGNYNNNWAPIAGKRLLIRNTQTANCDLSWVGQPTWTINGTNVTVSGTIRNNGPEPTADYGFWIETMHGTLTAEQVFMPTGFIAGGQRVSVSIPADGTFDYTQTGTAPAGSSLLVVADSTDIAPETDESNNWRSKTLSVPPGRGSVDVSIDSAAITPAQLAPAESSPFGNLQWSATLTNKKPTPTGDFWIELFPSTMGGIVLPSSGNTLSVSQKIALAANETKTFVFDQPFNRIPDGIYTVLVVANRNAVGDNPGDSFPSDNQFVIPGRVVLRNSTEPVANLGWSAGPAVTRSGNAISIIGAVHNSGSGASGLFWSEAFYGSFDSTGFFQRAGQIGGGSYIADLSADTGNPVIITGTVPAGTWVIGVCTDSTDLVPETDETDNYTYTTP